MRPPHSDDNFDIAFLAKNERFFDYSFLGRRKQVIKDVYASNRPVGDINLVEEFDVLLEKLPISREEFLVWAKTRESGNLAYRVYKREIEPKDAVQTAFGGSNP